jgi:cardiolipin synthase
MIIELSVALYGLFLVFTVVRILLDTHSTAKTFAYILMIILLPLVGLFIYYSFGINYRHKRTTQRVAAELERMADAYKGIVPDDTEAIVGSHKEHLEKYRELIHFIHRLGGERISNNRHELLINGERTYPEILRTLETAEHFIHMEYYAWENDVRGNQVKEVLLRKLKAGVQVRILYDAYASRKIKNNIVKELRAGGAEVHPVIDIKLTALANRLNHRDHRKVVVVDGHTGFVGGLNLSDRYDNSIDTGLWWRDTHVKITGGTVHEIQRHFLINWNVAQPKQLPITPDLFPAVAGGDTGEGAEFSQIVPGGPVYPLSNIMLTYFKIITQAKNKLYITNPYFIPNESILDALKQAALSGVDVRLMVPARSDSAIVGATSKFYYAEMLRTGVRIFQYTKGFVHAKTIVADTNLSVVGTANMDIRSFDLNFEIMSVIYGKRFAQQLESAFLEDLESCTEITYDDWKSVGTMDRLAYASARMASSFL